jgi:drug/metabolite transporter (DMT)-like permease
VRGPSTPHSGSSLTAPTSFLVGGFALLCIFWGTSWVAIKFSLNGLPPFLGASFRFLVAMAFLVAYARWRKRPLFPDPPLRRLALTTGLLVYVCNYGLIYWAELHLSAGTTALYFSTFPIFTSLLSNFLFRVERFQTFLYLGLLLAMSGVGVVFYDASNRDVASLTTLLATGAILISAASGAVSSLIVKTRLISISPVTLTFTQMAAGTGGLIGFGLLSGEAAHVSPNTQNLLAVVYLGVVSSAVAFVLYYWLLQRMSAVNLSLFVYITPLVAIASDWILLGQTLSPLTWGGAALVLLGILLSQWRRGLLRTLGPGKR